jgi:hypothetical protein
MERSYRWKNPLEGKNPRDGRSIWNSWRILRSKGWWYKDWHGFIVEAQQRTIDSCFFTTTT